MRTILEDIRNKKVSVNIPYRCECGGLLEVNDDNTYITCNNPNCEKSMVVKVMHALKCLGMFTDIGEVTAETIVNNYDLNNPMDIFLTEMLKGEITKGETQYQKTELQRASKKLISEYKRINEKGIRLDNFIDAFDFGMIGTTRAQDILSELNNPDEMYAILYSEKEKFIATKLGISEYTDTVKTIYQTIIINEEYIQKMAKMFRFKEAKANRKYTIALTGAITTIKDLEGNRIRPRERIKDVLGDLYGVTINIVYPRGDNFDYLVMDNKDMMSNNKFQKMKKNNWEGKVITAIEFEKQIAKDIGEEISYERNKQLNQI